VTKVRAVAVGIPDRLKDDLASLSGVVVVPDLSTASGVLEDYPDAHVVYGEHLFGPAVTGQPVFLLPGQVDSRHNQRVWVVVDAAPSTLGQLEWDDPRRLAAQAGVRLRAGRLLDVSDPGAWVSFDAVLDEPVDTPNTGG
jgi:hypothetical protein